MKKPQELQKNERRREMVAMIEENPAVTDGELAERFAVSVATVRLDRQAMGIPQMRERVAKAVRQKSSGFRDELRVIDLEEGRKGLALFTTREAMLNGVGVVSADCLYGVAAGFAQTLTGEIFSPLQVGNIKYKNPVKSGEELVVKGKVALTKADKKYIYLSFYRNKEEVFRAKFIMKVPTDGEA